MRKTSAILATTALLMTSAFATTPATSPLPACTHEAALQMGVVMLVLGLVTVAGAIAAIASTTQGTSTGTGA